MDSACPFRSAVWKWWIVVVVAPWFAPVETQAQQRYFRNYTAEDGLSQLVAQASYQDSAGYIWIGTQAGLNRFDGNIFEVFGTRQGLSNDWINVVVQDSEGDIWVGTNNGLNRWTAAEGFRSYNVVDGLPDKRVHSLAFTPDQTLWIGTGNGLAAWDGQNFRAITPDDGLPAGRIAAIQSAPSGDLWVGTVAGLYRKTESGFALLEELPAERVHELGVDTRGRLWAGVGEHVHVVEGRRSVAQYGENEGVRGLPARALLAARDGTVWVGTIEGLAMIQNDLVEFITVDKGLPFLSANTLLEDHEGVIWVGSVGGFAKFMGRAFINYGASDGLASSNARPILRDRTGDLWVGTLRGLNRFDGTSWTTYTREDGLTHEYTRSLHLDRQGWLWIGTMTGLNYYDGSDFRRVDTFDPKKSVVDITQDRSGAYWIASQNDGIYKGSLSGFYRVEVPGQTFQNARFLVDGRGDVWVSGDNGLSLWDGVTWRTFTTADGLASDEPYAIAEDHDGRIWFGYHSSVGISVYDGDSFTTYTTDDGLYNDAVYTVGVDPSNNIWIGTARGVDRFDGEAFVNYGPPEGYASNESNAGGFFVDLDETIWFGTAEGVSHYDPRYDLQLGGPPRLDIRRLLLGGEPASDDKASVPYAQRDMHATVSALSYINPKKLRLRYRLVGYDDNWKALNGYDITFTNLPAGEYALEVQGRKPQSDWSPATSASFEIEPPFWQEWWFGVLILGGFILLAGGAYKYRVYKVEARSRLLEGLVQERTTELQERKAHLEQTLNELTLVKEALEAANGELLEASRVKGEFLANMSHEIRTPMNGVVGMTELLLDTGLDRTQREYVECIDRCGDALLTIINDILDFSKIEAGMLELEVVEFDVRQLVGDVVEFFALRAEAKGIELIGWIHEGVPEVRGDPHRLRQILTNLLGNAMKFTEKGEVVVEVTYAGDSDQTAELRFSVRDTGIGIPTDAQSALFKSFSQVDGSTTRRYGGTGLGLAISKQLVEMMSGTIAVESVQGEGSRFSFTVMLKQSEPPGESVSHPALAGTRIVIVDDNETNRGILGRQTSAWGMRPIPAESGETALELLRNAANDEHPVGLVLVDQAMPEVAGTELVRRINSDPVLSGTPLVMMTSYGDHNRDQLAAELKLAGTVTKPIRQSTLFDLMVRALQPIDSGSGSKTYRGDRGPISSTAARILVVEDNAINQRVVQRALEKMGYDCDLARTGLDALAALDQGTYALVLMDVQMPTMDGFEATRAIRDRERGGPRLPIVAMTANAMQGERQRCLDHGMDDYISKPFRQRELRELVDRLVGASGRSASGNQLGLGASHQAIG